MYRLILYVNFLQLKRGTNILVSSFFYIFSTQAFFRYWNRAHLIDVLRLFLSLCERYLRKIYIHPIKFTKLFVQKLVFFIKFHFLIKMKTKVFFLMYLHQYKARYMYSIFWNYDTIFLVNL